MANKSSFQRGKLVELTEEELEGFELSELKCHSCSGYGNCGYRSYRIYQGKPVLICMQRKMKMLAEREGREWNPSA